MSRILCIQFRRAEFGVMHEQECISRALGDTATVQYISALDSGFGWDNPAGIIGDVVAVILGGSGDFDFDGGRSNDDPDKMMSYTLLESLTPLFEYIFKHDIPTLGICYGHQLLGAFAGVRVHSDASQKKSCSHQLSLLVSVHDHFLFAGLPPTFSAIYGHKDSLECVPEHATLLLEGGDKCRVPALQYKNNIFTTQFHPELTYSDIVYRLKNSAGYLPEGKTLEEMYTDDGDASKIVQNFAKYALQRG